MPEDQTQKNASVLGLVIYLQSLWDLAFHEYNRVINYGITPCLLNDYPNLIKSNLLVLTEMKDYGNLNKNNAIIVKLCKDVPKSNG